MFKDGQEEIRQSDVNHLTGLAVLSLAGRACKKNASIFSYKQRMRSIMADRELSDLGWFCDRQFHPFACWWSTLLYTQTLVFSCVVNLLRQEKKEWLSRWCSSHYVLFWVFGGFFFYTKQGLCQQFKYFRNLIYIILLNDVWTDNAM